ncbi:MAG: 2-oxoglutarate dehydrogenase complex dihydrolipoyllysine-residue succinyltransferase [Deltaproteobacteria bacterium]|nr:2-oxoglutarate dehydrogenase complex dihydrolipoyllysine-residue succinyltransferase [Deltaproteobacteria bacterium]
MKLDVNIPSPGESVNEVIITVLNKADGDYVEKDEILFEIESEKATLPIPAEAAGIVTMKVKEEDTVEVGSVACQIDTSVAKTKMIKTATEAAPDKNSSDNEPESKPTPSLIPEPPAVTTPEKKAPSIVAEKMIKERQLNQDSVIGTGKDGRITKQDVIQHTQPNQPEQKGEVKEISPQEPRSIIRKKISPLRKKIAEVLVQVKNETAMLTTFNEVDMSSIMAIRTKYKDQFIDKWGVKLGFMSFFSKAVIMSLEKYPDLNAYLDGDEIQYHHYVDLGISVSAPKGLVVPVVRNAETKQFHELEKEILTLAEKARNLSISIDEMKGGTFTITNGGVFGSLMSTPILNPPQSGILGMHNIVDRPVAIKGQVEIRPMMYIALSYDHRIVDGKVSVSFLKNIKSLIEAPEKMLLNL